nr:hypothetical protein [uncultured Methanolobus sp.]
MQLSKLDPAERKKREAQIRKTDERAVAFVFVVIFAYIASIWIFGIEDFHKDFIIFIKGHIQFLYYALIGLFSLLSIAALYLQAKNM